MTHPTPTRIMQAIHAFQLTAAMKAAIDLSVFTAIGVGRQTAEAIAEHCQTSKKGMRVLCDFLVAHEFLSKDGFLYGLAPDSAAFLDKNSPTYLGGMSHFQLGSAQRKAYEDLAPVIRKGGTVLNEASGAMSTADPMWEEFARSMMAAAAPAAQAIATLLNAKSGAPIKVLDVAAGHGLFGITIAQQNPHATVCAVDWPPVLDIAREHALNANVEERWNAIGGNAFDVELGHDYDVVLLTNFLHHFSPATIETLLRKVSGAIKPGGVVVTLEFVPNEDRVTPRDAATFALVMLAMTAEGDAYPFSEYEAMFKNSGFQHNELHRIEGYRQAIILSRQ